jgi:phosphoglycolate phosphatase-like HAD superfamily hydrolase
MKFQANACAGPKGEGGLDDFSPDCLIFDVDGVLIDTSESYPEMVRRAVETEWEAAGFSADAPGYSMPLNSVFKHHGGFNDDTHIAWGLLNIIAPENSGGSTDKLSELIPSPDELEGIIRSCGLDPARWIRGNFKEKFPLAQVRDRCSRIYFGDGEAGVYAAEKPMLRADWKELPLPAYVFTGRNVSEWNLAKNVLSWGDFPDERVVTSDSGLLKPSPDGLALICRKFGHSRPIFFGDTASDKMSFEAFGIGRFAAIGEILRGSALNFDSVGDALFSLIGWRDR